MLKEKFGNREVIIDTLYSQLQHLPIATNRISDIKSTFENIEKILRQLESQREDINNQKILVQHMLSKFPTQVIIKLEESKGLNDPWTVPKLRQSLQRYITIYTNAQRYEVNSRSTHFNVSNKTPDKSDAFRPVRNFTEQTSAEALVTNTDVPNQGKKSREATQPCIYCKGNHFNDSCQQYRNVSVRKKQLQKQGRCFICLKTGHVSKDCSTKFKPCYFCKMVGHHRSICPTKFAVLEESDVNKTNVNLSSTEVDQLPKYDGRTSDSAAVVSNTL